MIIVTQYIRRQRGRQLDAVMFDTAAAMRLILLLGIACHISLLISPGMTNAESITNNNHVLDRMPNLHDPPHRSNFFDSASVNNYPTTSDRSHLVESTGHKGTTTEYMTKFSSRNSIADPDPFINWDSLEFGLNGITTDAMWLNTVVVAAAVQDDYSRQLTNGGNDAASLAAEAASLWSSDASSCLFDGKTTLALHPAATVLNYGQSCKYIMCNVTVLADELVSIYSIRIGGWIKQPICCICFV